MGSRADDLAVGRLVNELIEGLARGDIRTQRELIRRYQRGARAIDRRGGLIYDTDVRDAIFEVLLVPLALKGFEAEAVLGA